MPGGWLGTSVSEAPRCAGPWPGGLLAELVDPSHP